MMVVVCDDECTILKPCIVVFWRQICSDPSNIHIYIYINVYLRRLAATPPPRLAVSSARTECSFLNEPCILSLQNARFCEEVRYCDTIILVNLAFCEHGTAPTQCRYLRLRCAVPRGSAGYRGGGRRKGALSL